MSKVTAPLLSFGAAGQIAKTQVYSTWKGRPYVRRYVTPSNPDSDGQKLTRAIFKYLFGLYRYADESVIAAMAAAASSARLTTANMFPRANLHTARHDIDNASLIFSPGAGGAPATPTGVATPADGAVSMAIPAPVLPNGWLAVPVMYAAAVEQWSGAGYADVGTDYTMVANSQDTPVAGVYTINLTPLTNDQAYTIVSWYSVARPDGSVAYGVSSVITATPTA
jgi:hypothetical protein